MAYHNNARKTAVVLNAEFSVPVLMNAVAHTVLGLADSRGTDGWNFLDYPSPGFGLNGRISEYPVIVLRSKRSVQLERLVLQLKAQNIAHNIFMDSMLGSSAEEQQRNTFEALPGRTRIICVALVGEEMEIRPFIKSYSLYTAANASDASGMESAS